MLYFCIFIVALAEPVEDKTTLYVALGVVFGLIGLIFIGLLITWICRREHQKEKRLEQLLDEKKQVELALSELHLNANSRNLYVPLDVLTDRSLRAIYDDEPIYAEIPEGIIPNLFPIETIYI